MTDDSEKRFHTVMDKLFHAPPKPRPKSTPTVTNPFSSYGVQLSRGRKRPSSMIDGLQKSSVSGGSVPTPLCRPWERGDLLRRLATFKSMTWFAKPKVVSAVNCARRGWVNVDMDTLACESCGARLFFTTPPSWTQQQVEKAALVFSLKLDNGHKLLCPWIDNSCDERLAQFPPMPAAVLVDQYKKRSSALLHLSALPVISSSAIDFMKSPQLEDFLKGSSIVELSQGNECDTESSVSNYQAQKLISLCGWEPRSLPYLVDFDWKNEHRHSMRDLSYSDSSHLDSSGQNCSSIVYSSEANMIETNEDPLPSREVQSDPKSVVLDCRLCGACVGLWSFSTISRPLELFRLVGYSDVNGANGSAHHRDVAEGISGTPAINGLGHETRNESREGIPNTAATLSASLYDRPSNLNLTIAGGPLPAKQNFRAMISVPVIGRNLRARISSGSDFRDHVCIRNSFQEGQDNIENALTGQDFVPEDVEILQGNKYADRHCSNDQSSCLNNVVREQGSTLRNENDSHISLNGTGTGQEFPETSTLVFHIEASIPKSSDSVEGSGKDVDLPENDGPVNQAVGYLSGSQVGDSTVTTSDDQVTITNWEFNENDTSMAIELVDCYLQQDPGTDTVCNAQADNQDSNAVKANIQQENNDVACFIEKMDKLAPPMISGKNPEQAPLDEAIVFDPIMQHRHFCPWIASADNTAPGWQQTLYALQRQKEFSSPSNNAPSSSLIEVDDPVSSVRKLFMSPSAKKMKPTPN